MWPEGEEGLPPLDGVVAAIGGFVGVGDRSPLDIELLVSDFFAQLGAGQRPPPPGEPDHVELLNGVVELCLHHLDRSPPRVVLDFLWVLDAFDPRWVHWPLHQRLEGSALPSRPAWAMDVGQAELRTAHVVSHETGDGVDIALVARHRSAGRDHVVAVYLDRTFGGLATDVLVHHDAEEYVRMSAGAPGMQVEEVDPARAAATIDVAIAATFAAGVPPAVADGFASRWGVVEQLIARVPTAEPLPGPVVASPEEQAEVVDRFLAGLDGTAARRDRDVLLEAVGFVAEELGGDPLRWSPAVTQLVLGGWLPFAVDDAHVAARFAQVLRAFVPWAQRERGWGDRYRDATLEAIDAVEAGDGPSGGGRVEILERALAEGVDLDDEEALDAFLDRYLDDER